MKIQKKNKKAMAISQVFLLVLGIFAIAFIIGSSMESVSAKGDVCTTPQGTGVCLDKTTTPCSGGTFVAGYCSGSTDIQCCVSSSTSSSTNEEKEISTSCVFDTDCGFQEECFAGYCLSASEDETSDGSNLVDQAVGTAKQAIVGDLSNKAYKKILAKLKGETTKEILKDLTQEEASKLVTAKSAIHFFVSDSEGKMAGLVHETTQGYFLEQPSGELVSISKTQAYQLSEGATTKPLLYTTVGQVASILAISVIAGTIARYLAPELGASLEQSQRLFWIASGGTAAGLTAGGFLGVTGGIKMFGSAIVGGAVIGLAVAAVLTLAIYKVESVEVVTYECLPWDASTENNCELCNNRDIPCSEYQCESLGQSCELVNPGTDEELCVYIDRGDLEYPVITPNEKNLLDNYVYNPLVLDFPDERGVKVVNTNNVEGCVSSFQPFSFGFTTDEPARCKYSFTREGDYESMDYLFSSGLKKYNHSMVLTFPGQANVEAEGLTYEEGFNEIFVRCEDSSGNYNLANFVFEFCVDETPDLAEPIIRATNPITETPIAFNQGSVPVTLYLNKPSDCSWSRTAKSYEEMQKENNLTCAQSISESTTYNGLPVYTCSGNLDGLANYESNDFYFQCKSFPLLDETLRVKTSNAYKYTLIGTRPLVIDSVSPNETIIKGSTGEGGKIKTTISAITLEGYNDGEAWCSYSPTQLDKDYIQFFNTGTYNHTQNLYLGEGEYNYSVKCCDLGNNCDTKDLTFEIEIDSSEPQIARAYYEDGYMKLITTEEAECVYSPYDCSYSFDDGASIQTRDNTNHFLSWDTEMDLFIKCQDAFENRPDSNKCQIVVRAYEEYSNDEE